MRVKESRPETRKPLDYDLDLCHDVYMQATTTPEGTMATKFDTVYYFAGGTENGEWRQVALMGRDAETVRQEVARMGYVAVKGLMSVGAPEGPPRK